MISSATRIINFRKWVKLYGLSWLGVYFMWALLNYRTWPDTDAYLEMGRGLLHHGIFGYQLSTGEYVPNAFRMPIFPLLLGVIDLLTSQREFTYLLFSILQTFLAAALPCIAFYFGSLLNTQSAWVAFFGMLLHPNFVVMSVSVLTDISFALLAGITAVLLWESGQRLTNRRAAVLGFTCGFACLIRPIMKLYPVFIVLWLGLFCGKPSRGRWISGTVAIGFFVLMLSPWLIRNAIMYKALVLETNQGLNLLWSNAHLVEPNSFETPDRLALKKYIRANVTDPMSFVYYRGTEYFYRNDLAVSRELSAIAKDTFLRAPLGIAQTWLANAKHMLIDQTHFDALYEMLHARAWYKTLTRGFAWSEDAANRRIYHVVLEIKRAAKWAYILVPIPSIFLMWKAGHLRLAAFMLLNVLYFFGLTAFVAGYDRYRLNIEPFFLTAFAFLIITAVSGVRKILARS
ncbi:MAG: ArnT family glycosyltransferase [Candidatus Sumerlaeaceae bacterium]